jgi:hypothetical protein
MCNRKGGFRVLSVGIGCLSVMGLLIVGSVRSEDTGPKKGRHLDKSNVAEFAQPEAPQPDLPVPDPSKLVHIEPPTKQFVSANSATVLASDNPKVKPGLVKWHANLAEACEASKKSGKPVLLFQLMGKLDDQFC